MSRAQQTPWLPTVGQFCAWCQVDPGEIGLPVSDEAFQEARMEAGKHADIREWSHTAVYLAASQTGMHDLKTVEDNQRTKIKQIKARFDLHYSKLVQRVIDGEELQVPKSRQLAYTPPQQAGLKAPEEARQSLRGLF